MVITDNLIGNIIIESELFFFINIVYNNRTIALAVCVDKYESCTLEITGIKMPADPEAVVLDMTQEQQIDVCRFDTTVTQRRMFAGSVSDG